jgi:predicted nucleic acid-binding protein
VSAKLEEHRAAGRWLSVPIPEDALEVCSRLSREYGPKLWMRTLDTLHVACALELKAERFWTFDERQGKLAKAAGLKTSK